MKSPPEHQLPLPLDELAAAPSAVPIEGSVRVVLPAHLLDVARECRRRQLQRLPGSWTQPAEHLPQVEREVIRAALGVALTVEIEWVAA